jgi:predicted RNA-binding Zn-ribbon protein involved in translation (DUF1610 family)
MVTSIWKCHSCGEFFVPANQQFKCPVCGGISAPSSDYDSDKDGLWEPEIKKDYQCPECKETMRLGYLVETNSLIQVTTLFEGLYWTADELGTIGTRVPLKAYACPKCGNVDIRIRRLNNNRRKILLAPTK